MTSLSNRLYNRLHPAAEQATEHADARPPTACQHDCCDQLRADIGRLTTALAYTRASLSDARTRLSDARREIAQLTEQLRAATTAQPRTAAYWRRRYEQEHANNARLDDRLALAEGRPTFAAGGVQ